MKIKMYLHPGYVDLNSAFGNSPREFYSLLAGRGIEIEEKHWDGTLITIPNDEPVMVRASTMMKCSWKDLAELCVKLGHFLFYDGYAIGEDGSGKFGLVEEAEKFLDKLSRS